MSSKSIKYGDLFSGIGCVAQALKSLNIPFTYEFACDNDRHCKANITHNFPVVQFYDDVRTITSLPKVDLFTAGFPCQPFSTTNTQKKGLNHKSGDLFDETFRCLQLCDPEVFILENVAALTNKTHRVYFKHIQQCLQSLNQYDVQHKILNSKDFGTPQNRERLYIVGVKGRAPIFPDPRPLDLTLSDIIDQQIPLDVNLSNSKAMPDIMAKMDTNVMYISNGQSSGQFTRMRPIDRFPYSYCLTTTGNGGLYYKDVDGILYSRRYTINEIRQLQRINSSFNNICSDHQFAKQIGNGMDVNMMAQLIELNCVH